VVDRFGPRAIMAMGAALFGGSVLLLASMTPDGPYAIELLPGLAITPVGILFGFVASMIAATSGMPDDEQGLASGLLATFQQIGQALGLAVILNVVAFAENRAAASGLVGASARVPGYRAGFVVEAGFAALAVLVALLVVQKSKVKASDRPVVAMH
jgi:MFS family permease